MLRRLAFLASLLASLGGLALASPAAAEEMSISVPVTGMGNWEFQGPVEVTDGKFEEYFNSGNARLQIWGRIEGDRITIGGHIKVTGFYEQGSGFNIAGSFKGDKFVGTFVEPLNYGKSHRGQITLTRPAAQAAAAPDASTAPEAPTPPAAAPETAPAPPAAATPESLEPKLSAAQRQAVQRQLTILGFYDRAIDGSFGAGTRAAIGRFQLANAFDATGYLDATSMRVLKDLSKAREKEIAAAAARRQADQQAAAAQDAAAAKTLADQQAAQEQAAAERKAADEQARLEAAKLETERQALDAQKADLKRQQDALAKAQQEAAAAPEPAAPATITPPSATAATTPAVAAPAVAAPSASGDFAGVIAALQPIDEVYIAVKPAKIRSAPSVAAARVGTLNVGDRIEVMGRLPGQDWYLVARDEQPIGYVVINQLAAESDATRATSAAAAADAAPAATQTAALPPEFANLDFGRYHALIIGNDRYRSLPQLETAVGDAEAVAELLDRNYHFDVRLLTNATEEDIIGALTQMRRELEFGDNLLIYYAGHGWQDKDTQEGYWLPVDAAEDNQSNWVSNADITTALKALKAKHIIIVADSSYSGSLTRSANISLRGIDYIERIVKKKARTVLTSGGEEPVLDSGGAGHSVFARAFLTALEENDGVIDGQELFRRLRDSVVANASQTPEYGDIRGAGHDGGDFLFVRR